MLLFTVPEVAAIRQGKKRATLALRSERIDPGRTRYLRRLVVECDEDGKPLTERIEVVQQAVKDRDERRPVLLTIDAVEDVEIDQLQLIQVRACGFRTTDAARLDWYGKHPRSPGAQLVHFTLGDVRDLPLFLNWTGRRPGDYTRNRRRAMDDLETLTPAQIDELTAAAKQRDERRRADTAKHLAEPTLAARIARIEAYAPTVLAEIRQELKIITQRTVRAERRLDRVP